MGRPIGRRKRPKLTNLAIQVECLPEHCWRCGKLVKKYDVVRGVAILYCKFFRKLLCPAAGDSVAERCSDCHLAQRVADGESPW